MWIIGVDRDDWDARVTYLFRRCTVYRLQFRLELESTRPRDRETSVGTGSLTLMFRPAPGGDGATALHGGYWVAPRPQEALSSDFAFESVDCGPEARTCLPEDDRVSGSAYGRVALQRRVRTQVIRVVEPRADDFSTAAEIDRRRGGSIVIETNERVEGDDRIQMHFAAPAVHLLSVSRLHGNPTHQHHGSYLYFSALDRSFGALPALEGWTREGHPLLYSAATAANSRNGFAHLVGIYQLWHRPDLFPADEIVTEFEPRPADDIGPPRPPLRPPPGR